MRGRERASEIERESRVVGGAIVLSNTSNQILSSLTSLSLGVSNPN